MKYKIFAAAIALAAAFSIKATAAEEIKSINQTEFIDSIFDYRNDSTARKMPLPAVVDFWAPWCAPCLRLSPVIDELAEQYAGKVRFYKLNIDDNMELARDLGISSIPLVVLFPNDGTPMRGMTGVQPKEFIEKTINETLLRSEQETR